MPPLPPLGQLLLVLAGSCLLGATAAALLDLLAARGDRRVAVQSFCGTASVLLAAFLATEALRRGGIPTLSGADVLAWLALGGVAAHLLFVALFSVRALAPFLLPFATACAMTAPLAGDTPWSASAGTPSPWGALHGIAALAGMVAFASAAATGALYLVQDRRLRTAPARSSRLPDVETLDRLNLGSLLAALSVWTLSLVAGALQARQSWGDAWAGSRLVALSGAAWLLAAAVSAVRLGAALRGRKVAVLSIAAFLLAAAALVWGGHR